MQAGSFCSQMSPPFPSFAPSLPRSRSTMNPPVLPLFLDHVPFSFSSLKNIPLPSSARYCAPPTPLAPYSSDTPSSPFSPVSSSGRSVLYLRAVRRFATRSAQLCPFGVVRLVRAARVSPSPSISRAVSPPKLQTPPFFPFDQVFLVVLFGVSSEFTPIVVVIIREFSFFFSPCVFLQP